MSLTLTYGASSVVFKNPDFSDSKQVETNAVLRETRHGELKGFRSTDWPTVTNWTYTFTGVREVVVIAYKAFLAIAEGLKVTLLDHNSATHYGYIVSSPEVETLKDVLSYTVSFEFMEVS